METTAAAAPVQTTAKPRVLLIEQWRTDAQVLAAFKGEAGLLEPVVARLGMTGPLQVAGWAHACARAWKRWEAEQAISFDEYVESVAEAVALPVGGNTPAGGHKPAEGSPEESIGVAPPGPKHDNDSRNPVPPTPAPMRPAL